MEKNGFFCVFLLGVISSFRGKIQNIHIKTIKVSERRN